MIATLPGAAPSVRVGDFEGPLDLLLHLCRTNEVDLTRLPVRTITDQYLARLESAEFRDLESAGAWLVLAATLVYLKSRLLLPPGDETTEELDDEGLELRRDLEARLREYAAVKALGAWLAEREAQQALIWGRPFPTLPGAAEIPLEDVGIDLLVRALDALAASRAPGAPREVGAEPLSIADRMAEILAVLRDTWSLLFSTALGAAPTRPEVVVSLLAVLELARLGHVRARQTELFGDIVIERRAEVPGGTGRQLGDLAGHGA